jgi:hypothetical protein
LIGIPADLALNVLILVGHTTFDLDLFLFCVVFAFFELAAGLLLDGRIII